MKGSSTATLSTRLSTKLLPFPTSAKAFSPRKLDEVAFATLISNETQYLRSARTNLANSLKEPQFRSSSAPDSSGPADSINISLPDLESQGKVSTASQRLILPTWNVYVAFHLSEARRSQALSDTQARCKVLTPHPIRSMASVDLPKPESVHWTPGGSTKVGFGSSQGQSFSIYESPECGWDRSTNPYLWASGCVLEQGDTSVGPLGRLKETKSHNTNP